jgi:hypothetical protein
MLAFEAETTSGGHSMDLKAVREEAIEATTRSFWEKSGFVPDEDSEEWEEEYRRQFEQAKKRHAAGGASDIKPTVADAPPETEAGWAALTGAPTQIRWAAGLRGDRLKEIRDPGIRQWLATTWTKSKSWIDTSSLSTDIFLQRIAPHYAEFCRQTEEQARRRAANREAAAEAADRLRRQVEEAGITVEGLIELIDIAERLPMLPIKAKLAELAAEGRSLRVFETDDPAVLMVLEKAGAKRTDYAIERDEGLVADLRLYSQSLALS